MGRKLEELGHRYGRGVVIKEYGRDKYGRVIWKVRCDDGNVYYARGDHLRRGLILSCGCLKRERASKAHKGVCLSDDHRHKLSVAHIGVQAGDKHPLFGKHHTAASKKKMSMSKVGKYAGENHPMYGKYGELSSNWKGGITFEPYCQIWGDEEYKESIKARDNHICMKCGITKMLSLKVFSQDLVIHHIDYNKKNCHPSNLITLCNSCNAKANFNRDLHECFYKAVMCSRLEV